MAVALPALPARPLHALLKWLVPAIATASVIALARRVRRRQAARLAPSTPSAKAACAHCSERPVQLTPRKALLGDLERAFIGLSKDPTACVKRECYIGWHDYFMSVAMLSAFRSKDPNRQVGACIVDPKTQRIVGIGYNGFPIGINDDSLPWARSATSWLDTKYPYVCHAEVNAILNKNCESLAGCRMYVTLHPCNECAKLIIQSRISEVVFFSGAHRGEESMQASRKMFKLAGIKMWQHRPSSARIVLDFEDEQ
ncbi:hypothetical protein AB1Y20_022278 [Prymnesium parvum]|uniref:dCMP deaminase n=1 Tax=Prymnesium parvum TaxID=97485 RepID=A0AB34JFR4_PRYPA